MRTLYKWITQIVDPTWVAKGLGGYLRYLADWRRYARLPGAEAIRLMDSYPQVHDRTETIEIDPHYFYGNGWAMRRIISAAPQWHVDIGSQSMFVNLLGATIPVVFVDYRPLARPLTGLRCLAGNIVALPFTNSSIGSLSCLHVIEHIGLGRYGDPLDPDGTRKAARELSRVLAPGGNLFLVTPVGRQRVCFNAHRIHTPETIREYFSDLELLEFSGVDDDSRFVERVDMAVFSDSYYACGMFWFRMPKSPKGINGVGGWTL